MIGIAERKLVLSHLWIAFIAFILACFLGEYQVLERSGIVPKLASPYQYFKSVSSHGVFMGYVLPTFFIMGFGYFTAVTSLRQSIPAIKLAWLGYAVAVSGITIAAITLLAGLASVLYTFYLPMQAHVVFYIGVTLLILGSWVYGYIILAMFRQWKIANPKQAVPLAMFATTANVFLWLWGSLGVLSEMFFQEIPLALGWMTTVDVGLSRTLFAWTLHPLVYFWLIPAYTAYYVFVPKQAGGYLFSDEMARAAFIILIIFSLPVGFHHLYMDPEHARGWKLLHGIGTFIVSLPTLATGFTVIASLEIAGRLRGGKGRFGWILMLPWANSMVLAAILSLLMLIGGGFGGVVNALMDPMTHNTAWVPAHFHLIFAGTTVIMYFAIAYYLWPMLVQKPIFSKELVLVQLWIWFIGISVLTTPWHALGILGEPRRISIVIYDIYLSFVWKPLELIMIVGGLIVLSSACLFIYNLVKTQFSAATEIEIPQIEYAETAQPVTDLPEFLNDFTLWNKVIAVLLAISFGIPILQLLFSRGISVPAFGV
jgi:cytochrome c oxidase subunit I